MKLCSIAGLMVAFLMAGVVCGEELNHDMQTLQGTWVLVGGEKDGMPISYDDVVDSSLQVEGDEHEVKVGTMYLKGTHTMRMTTTPKEIDAHDITGPTKGENRGIYEFIGNNQFRVSFSPTGKDRPTDFVTKRGTGQFTHLWKRIAIE
jgi:uncharacterized protein (TIGR03067 family)